MAARADGHAAVEFLPVGLQDLAPSPGRYDCIWIQWCVGHLTDADFPQFFQRAQVRTRVCTDVCVYVWMYVCMCVYTCVGMYVCMDVGMDVCVYKRV